MGRTVYTTILDDGGLQKMEALATKIRNWITEQDGLNQLTVEYSDAMGSYGHYRIYSLVGRCVDGPSRIFHVGAVVEETSGSKAQRVQFDEAMNQWLNEHDPDGTGDVQVIPYLHIFCYPVSPQCGAVCIVSHPREDEKNE